MATKPSYLLVDTQVLPDIFPKVIEAKRLLQTGKCKTASEAAAKQGVSRSAFYKYKDCVFRMEEMGKDRIVTLFCTLIDTPGVLSGILKMFAAVKANILTVNQNIPVNSVANITISFRTQDMTGTVEGLLKKLKAMEGVKAAEILSGE